MARIGFGITHVYGLTETYGPAGVQENLSEQIRLNGRQGARYPMQEGMTVLDAGTLTEVPADGHTMGEVMFSGNVVTKGNLKNPESTAKAFEGGWFHTGDLGVIEPDHYVKLKDRSKDIIISGGENISSLEVEDALYRHPAIPPSPPAPSSPARTTNGAKPRSPSSNGDPAPWRAPKN